MGKVNTNLHFSKVINRLNRLNLYNGFYTLESAIINSYKKSMPIESQTCSFALKNNFHSFPVVFIKYTVG